MNISSLHTPGISQTTLNQVSVRLLKKQVIELGKIPGKITKILFVSKYRLAHIRATKTDYVVIFAGHVDEEADQAD